MLATECVPIVVKFKGSAVTDLSLGSGQSHVKRLLYLPTVVKSRPFTLRAARVRFPLSDVKQNLGSPTESRGPVMFFGCLLFSTFSLCLSS